MTQSTSSETSSNAPVQRAAPPVKLLRFEALDMVRTPGVATFVISLLIFLIMGSIVWAMFIPWRQSVTGAGRVIVFSPMYRPQMIEAQIPGRLLAWYVRDGENVQEGQAIARLAELDSRFLDTNQLISLQSQKAALVTRREACEARIKKLKSQLNNSTGSQSAAVPAAKQKVKQAKDRVYALEQAVEAAKQNLQTTQWQVDRITSLYNDGLRSKRDLELVELEKVKAQTGLQQAMAALDVGNQDTSIAALESQRTVADTGGSLNVIEAAMADASQTLATTAAEIYKLDIDLQNLKSRVLQRTVVAPIDGRIVRLMRVGAGETVNAGEVLAVLAPKTQDRAAEIFIRDWDAPLVSAGHEVRLQIAGWPALQFIGWPRIAIGTFAGRVQVVDAVDDGKNRYRVIVVPDQKAIDAHTADPWPSTDYLRPGAQVTGWILLGNVPLWYELWRQFNGWQPTVPPPETVEPDTRGKH